ncbi:MAG: hypothetical protein OEV64_00060 [Desulfobulbaceae bacterium]|nr:hypothetical protein [Desulfobulbaceae bacterium]
MSHEAFEKRLAGITEEITLLQAQVSSLNDRFSRIESFQQKLAATNTEESLDVDQYSSIPDIDSSEILDKVAKTSLLPRIAAVCFILVFALILRTLTDNNIINTRAGSLIGVFYAAGLIIWGVRLLKKGSKLAAVFKTSGVFLLYMILLETHTRFESFSSFFVYTCLASVLLSVSWVSIKNKLSGFNTLGIFGTALAASLIDFPQPHFGQLHLLLLTANILAFISAKIIGKGEWNRLLVFGLTICMSILWTLRLQAELNLNEVVPAFASLNWYIPITLLFITSFTLMPIILVIRKTTFSILDLLLPFLSATWLFSLLNAGLEALSFSPLITGVSAAAWALFYAAFSGSRICKTDRDVPALSAMVIAAFFLLVAALPNITGDILPALIIWSFLGLGLSMAAQKYELNGLRFFSYLFQSIVCIIGIVSGKFIAATTTPVISGATAGLLMTVSGYQFNMFRRNPPSSHGFFKHVDRSDNSCILLLVTALISCFMMLQITGYQILLAISSTADKDLPGIQSLLLNIGAMAIFLHARKTRKKEFLAIAVFLAIVNGFKVFLYDMFNTGSGPLVLSVLSFGGVAAVASLVLSKWSSSGNNEN